MTNRCPTCYKPLEASLPDRIVAFLAQMGRPTKPVEIRQALAVSDTTLYQTLRRMDQRGTIRRATQDGDSGWVLVQHDKPEQIEHDVARVQSWVNDLVVLVETRGEVHPDATARFLQDLDAPDEIHDSLIEMAVQTNRIRRNDGVLESMGG